MTVLSIVKPLPAAFLAQSGFASNGNASAVITPDPKEAAIVTAAGAVYVDIDFGAAITLDTIFVGYTNLPSATALTAQGGAGSSTDAVLGNLYTAPADAGTPQHFIAVLTVPVTVRYLRISGNLPANATIGVICGGLSLRPEYGRDFGSGRPITDTGTATRLFGGGFAVDYGAVLGGFVYTLAELQDSEIKTLWAIVKSLGNTRSILVIEDPDATAGLNERIHWGILAKLDPYERYAIGATRWGMRVDDWG